MRKKDTLLEKEKSEKKNTTKTSQHGTASKRQISDPSVGPMLGNHHPASGACKECDRSSLVKMPPLCEWSKSCAPPLPFDKLAKIHRVAKIQKCCNQKLHLEYLEVGAIESTY